MTTIHKYTLDPNKLAVEMPIGANVLTVQNQNENVCIWALVDTKKETETRYFEIFGTGHNIPVDMGIERKYINTFQLQGGTIVFHLFERIN